MANELIVLEKLKEKMSTGEGREMIEATLGQSIDAKEVKKYLMGAMMEIKGKATLLSCAPDSIIKCLCECFQLGLAIDNRHLAYLVPFGGACTLMPGFQGYVYKIKEADSTAHIIVGIVRQGDKFECGMESGHATYKHTPANAFDDSTNNIVGAYCYIKTDNGSSLERMSKKELDKVRNASKMKTGAVWSNWELEMIKKSVIRRACKLQFMEAVAKLNAIDDRLFDISGKPKTVELAKTVPMPEPIEAAICHDEPTPPEAQPSPDMPGDSQNAPITEPGTDSKPNKEQAQPKDVDELSFSGEVKMYMPKSGDILAGILVAGAWYNSENAEVVALLENLKGQQVSGTYVVKKNGLRDVNIITTIADAE